MTSANPHGEPLVIGNDEAQRRLVGIADAFLVHDREIVVRCDDSVLRAGPAFIRRARGHVPVPIPLADDGPTVLALGGYLKSTVCVLKGREAFLSQHIGGLDNAAAIGFLEETVAHLLAILDVRPDLIAHDLHPDFASTHLALRLAAERGIPTPVSYTHLDVYKRQVQIEQDILAKNNAYAAANRRWFDERGILALNLVSSPGSGKTALLVRTIELLNGKVAISVVEGDQQTSNDAERIRATGVAALQINTGKGCHLDGHMVGHALERLQPADESLFLIENVGNLVCPAAFDLGEQHKVAILSVTEGEDKPLK